MGKLARVSRVLRRHYERAKGKSISQRRLVPAHGSEALMEKNQNISALLPGIGTAS